MTPPITIKGSIYYIRLLYHTVEERIYLDVRKWKDISTELANGYEPTEAGLIEDVNDWPLLITHLFKLFEKGRKKAKEIQ